MTRLNYADIYFLNNIIPYLTIKYAAYYIHCPCLLRSTAMMPCPKNVVCLCAKIKISKLKIYDIL